ncbi:hypothetical protein HUT16_24575 [Kitasatospora sp. NA04385]|uniref:hypothetical protein n=1 Tax=Kitasatospora sp. NA04385 TaxID=2742135 RepID=UPI001591DECC|nr:hypothetical protein [Kitasatospora sp. NA04385]QKW21809.1 hypothetical protein HUT16_24575 [Kitasatospora sp. NA04385]
MGEGADAGFAGDPAQALLRIRDQQGRLCGLGFVADRSGTVVTAHEAVAGLPRLVLHTPGGQSRVLGPESVDLLPDRGLALLRTAAVGGVPAPPCRSGAARSPAPSPCRTSAGRTARPPWPGAARSAGRAAAAATAPWCAPSPASCCSTWRRPRSPGRPSSTRRPARCSP